MPDAATAPAAARHRRALHGRRRRHHPAGPPRRSDRAPSRRSPLLVLVVAAAAAVVGGVVALTGPSDEASAVDAPPASGRRAASRSSRWSARWSHAAPDDPIVHPGAPGRSHLHDFFGNVATDADSTRRGASLGRDTTLPEPARHRGLLGAGPAPATALPVTPTGSVAYYRPGPGVDPASVRPYPAGLMMVAGDRHRRTSSRSTVAAWHCGASPILAARAADVPPHRPARRADRVPRLLGRRAPRQRRPPQPRRPQRRGPLPRRPPGRRSRS